jgi:phthiocerol/phenolphthiocerol synthesis type-I polyketide synthase E
MSQGGTTSLSKRLAALSQEKRELLKRLMEEEGLKAPAGGAESSVPTTGAPGPNPSCRVSLAGPRSQVTDFYEWVNRRLDESPFGRHSIFLNFGYVADGSPEQAAIVLPGHALNRNCLKLVLEVIGDRDLAGCRVLDVGCGRGGTASVVNSYFKPRVVAGLDLCAPAVAFCHRSQGGPRTFFVQGDAQALPWRDESFDVVTNLESSHSYPDIEGFYREVARVLTGGGAFLYADILGRARLPACRQALRAAGLLMEEEREITANVVASCDEAARIHLEAFGVKSVENDLDNFLALPGSEAYEDMATGRSVYAIYRLRKEVTA